MNDMVEVATPKVAPYQLVVVRNPFDRADLRVETIFPDSLPSVSTVVRTTVPMGTEVVVSINGAVVDRDTWNTRFLEPNDQLIIVPTVHGGDNGIIGSILTIAVMVYAPYLSAGVLGGAGMMSAGGAAFMTASAGFAMTALNIGIGMVGSMLIGSLFAPSKPSLPTRELGSFDNSPSYGWSPQTMQTPGAPLARAYGRVKLRGNIIAGFIDTADATSTNNKQVVHALIDLGVGPYSALNDITINDEPITSFQDVTVISRLGKLTQSPIDGFEDTRIARVYNTRLFGSGAAVTKTTVGSSFGALEVVLTAPNGLYYSNDAGGLSSCGYYIRLEISDDGGTTWKYIGGTSNAVGGLVIPPGGRWSRGFWSTEEDVPSTWTELASGSATLADHTDGAYAEEYTPFGEWDYSYPTYWRWMPVGTHSVSTGMDDSVLMQGSSPKAIRRTFRVNGLVVGNTYQVRATNLGLDNSADSRYGSAIYFAELNEVILDDFTYPRSVLVAVKAVAAEQLNGQVNFACIADAAKVWVYRSGAWHFEWSNNPAWVCYDILTQPLNYDYAASSPTLGADVARFDGFAPSRISLQTFIGWAAFCDTLVPNTEGGTEKRCTFDGVFDTETDMWSAAMDVASTARAVLVMVGTTVAAVWDDAQTTPVQVFTAANSTSFSETFLPMEGRASTIEVEFQNAEIGYGRDIVTVVNPDLAAAWGVSTPLRKAMRGVTRASQVWREAQTMLARNQLLQRTAELSVDVDALVATVGSRVDIQADVPMWGEGGRAVSGTTTTVVLDHPITFDTNAARDITVRLATAGNVNHVIETRAITMPGGAYPQTVSTITCAAFTTAVSQYDVWAIGFTSQATKPFVVTGMSRDSDFRIRLFLIEYNASLYNLDAGLPELPIANYSSSIGFATVLTVNPNPSIGEPANVPSEHLLRNTDGTIVVMTNLRWWYSDISKVSEACVLWREAHGGPISRAYTKDSYITVGPTPDGIDPVTSEALTYQFWVLTKNALGLWSTATTAPQFEYAPVGKSAPPANVSSFSVVEQVDGTRSFEWSAVTDPDLSHYEIRYSATDLAWAAQSVWAESLQTTNALNTRDPLFAAGNWYFSIKAVDTSGNYSGTATKASVGTPVVFSQSPSGPILNTEVSSTTSDLLWINSDGTDIDVELRFGRTTGGSASFTWNGTLMQLTKAFMPTEFGINNISATAPVAPFAKQVWLDVS